MMTKLIGVAGSCVAVIGSLTKALSSSGIGHLVKTEQLLELIDDDESRSESASRASRTASTRPSAPRQRRPWSRHQIDTGSLLHSTIRWQSAYQCLRINSLRW